MTINFLHAEHHESECGVVAGIRMCRFLMITLSLLLLLAPMGAAGLAETTPTSSVKATIDEVLAVLSDPAMKVPEKQAERRAKLEEIIGGRFDYEEMAKRTLPTQWKSLKTEQQKEFVTLFQQFLANSYVGNVDGYSGEQIEYGKERQKGDFAEVQTKVVSPKVQIPLDYRLLKKNGEWRVYDVVIDGVSLMKNYRGQFARIIDSDSFDTLLEKLRTKTDLGASS